MNDFRFLVVCCVLIIAALLVVGSVSHGVIRHVVQTAPLWVAIVLGSRRSEWSKWAAIPCFLFWLIVMVLIWLFLLGLARIITGTFSPTEIAMTIIVGLASFSGLVSAVATKTSAPPFKAAALAIVLAVVQVAALRISLLPAIAHR